MLTRRAWLLPHLLSLDAPLVALVWQAWWSTTVGIRLLPAHRAALGFAVWAIYLVDRLADARGPERPDTATARHRFSRRWRGPLGALLAAAGTGLAAVTVFGGLPATDVRAGLGLAAVTGGYFVWVHRRPRPVDGWWKEAWVGAAFAAGTALFMRNELAAGEWLAVGAFGVLCFANCGLITRWETDPRAGARGRFLRGTCTALVMGAAAMALMGRGTTPSAPVAFAAAGLRLLDGPMGARRSSETRRVLADVVLLTPLWWLLRAWH